MNLIWRFCWTLLFSRFAPPARFEEECTTSFTVLPTDVDALLHLNNGRYFSLLDLARINFMIRNKLFPLLKQHKIYPVVASEMIRFKRSLGLLQRFNITTNIIGWDNKFFYIVHYFKRQQQLHAMAIVKARLLKNNEGVSPEEVLALIGQPAMSKPLPAWVKNWQLADQNFYEEAVKTTAPY